MIRNPSKINSILSFLNEKDDDDYNNNYNYNIILTTVVAFTLFGDVISRFCGCCECSKEIPLKSNFSYCREQCQNRMQNIRLFLYF
jgi:hypothetical protein